MCPSHLIQTRRVPSGVQCAKPPLADVHRLMHHACFPDTQGLCYFFLLNLGIKYLWHWLSLGKRAHGDVEEKISGIWWSLGTTPTWLGFGNGLWHVSNWIILCSPEWNSCDPPPILYLQCTWHCFIKEIRLCYLTCWSCQKPHRLCRKKKKILFNLLVVQLSGRGGLIPWKSTVIGKCTMCLSLFSSEQGAVLQLLLMGVVALLDNIYFNQIKETNCREIHNIHSKNLQADWIFQK